MSSSVAEKLARKSSRRPASSKQVRLKLVYIDFWSSVKLSFLVGLCLAIIAIVGTFLVWTVLNQTGIFDQVNSLFKDISGAGGADLKSILGLGQVMGFRVLSDDPATCSVFCDRTTIPARKDARAASSFEVSSLARSAERLSARASS